MTTNRHRIVGAGLFAVDVIVRPDGTLSRCALGGSAGNVLYILGALGWNPTPVGTLGEDAAAQVVRNEFAKVGADLDYLLERSNFRTPIVYQHQRSVDGEATHHFSFVCPICGARHRPHADDGTDIAINAAKLPKAVAFFLDRPTRVGVELAELYARNGALVVFEPSTVGDDLALFARALKSARIVKYADDRISDLSHFDLSAVSIEIQTLGSAGLKFRAPSLSNDWLHMGAYSLPYLQDTAGAGDWCTAGMIFELFKAGTADGLGSDYNTLVRALAFGQALSTLNCMTEGARGLCAAWSPGQILRSARELGLARVRSLYSGELATSSRMVEPRLTSLSGRVSKPWRRRGSATLQTDPGLCCGSP